MKFTKILVMLIAITAFTACKENEKTTETTVLEKETVIVTDTVAAPKEATGTSVKVGSDGIEVKSKDVQVEVK